VLLAFRKLPRPAQVLNPVVDVATEESPAVLLPAGVLRGVSLGQDNHAGTVLLACNDPQVLPPLAPVTERLHVWCRELSGDINESFLLHGIEYGFSIIDRPCALENVFCRNYKSVLMDDRVKVEAQIRKEVLLGRYIVVPSPPAVVSSLGAVPKAGSSKIRLIHDLSRPDGGLNRYGVDSSVKYTSLDYALTLLKSDCYLAKIDLSEAYRSIPINSCCFGLTGLQWTFFGHETPTYLYDARLPFGSSLSCRIFQSISDSIVRIMAKKGYLIVSYIDDFMLISDTKVGCDAALAALILLIEDLGLTINWDKVALPSQNMTFLGVNIDCVNRVLSLPAKKLAEAKTLVCSWSRKTKCTKKELQSLIGRLNWCSKVVRGGRTFLRNLIDLLPKVTQQWHYVRLTPGAKSDINWWIVGLTRFHGSTPFAVDIPLHTHEFATDACLIGGAGHFMDDWFYTSWSVDYPELAGADINILELQTVLVAAKRWGPSWSGCHLLVRSDNFATVAAINNSTTRSPGLLSIVKELFWLSVQYNFRLSAKHIAGTLNIFSDNLSRLHNRYNAAIAHDMLTCSVPGVIVCKNQMSYAAYVFLQNAWTEI
jgi:hypothetical protein